jgi:hypothetical protein
LSLTQLHTLHYSQELFLWLIHFELSSKSCQGMCFVKVQWGALIYLYRSWCLICKQPLPRSSTLTPLHTMQELVSLTYLFWTFSKSHQGVWISLSGVLIYLYRSRCPICG